MEKFVLVCDMGGSRGHEEIEKHKILERHQEMQLSQKMTKTV